MVKSPSKEIRGPNTWIILQTLPTLHITNWKACIIQIHKARILFLSAIFTLGFREALFSHFGSWFSWSDNLDLVAPWLGLGKRFVKSSLLQGRVFGVRVWDQRAVVSDCGMWGGWGWDGRTGSIGGFGRRLGMLLEKKSTRQIKSLTSLQKDAASDFSQKKKKKNQDRKCTKQSNSHSRRRQVLSQGSVLSVSLQQYVTATSFSSFYGIKFLKSSSAAL